MQFQRFGSIVNIDSITGPQAHKTITATLRAKREWAYWPRLLRLKWDHKVFAATASPQATLPLRWLLILQKIPNSPPLFLNELPMQRWGEQDETVGAAVFLPIQSASYINRTVIFVDWGMSCQVLALKNRPAMLEIVGLISTKAMPRMVHSAQTRSSINWYRFLKPME